MKNYIGVTYSNKPKTDYPIKLIEYLFKRKPNIFKGYEFPSHSHILDLGCGRGDHLVAFCAHGFKAEGFDQCQPITEIGKSYSITIGNIEKSLPYRNKTFDIVFCKSVIEHLYYPEKLFQEVYRILKNGGVFITLTPDWDSTQEIFYQDFTHRTPFTLKSLKDIYKMNEFSVVRCHKFRQLPFLWAHPWLTPICKFISCFYHPNTTNKLIKFSKEKMLLGIGTKHEEKKFTGT